LAQFWSTRSVSILNWVASVRFAQRLARVALGDRNANRDGRETIEYVNWWYQQKLQMRFDPQSEPRVSLGTLHLAGAGSRAMLAGLRRETDYKGRFALGVRRLDSVQYLFPGWIALLYGRRRLAR
jgi:hypothetical protein